MQAASLTEIGRLKKDAAESLRRGDGDKARGLLDRVLDLLGTRPPSPARDTEPDDLEHLGRHFTRGDAGSAQKAACCQEELGSRGRSDYQSGRETRRWQQNLLVEEPLRGRLMIPSQPRQGLKVPVAVQPISNERNPELQGTAGFPGSRKFFPGLA